VEIPKQPIPESFETDDTKSYQQPRCPKCGSLDVSFEELHKIAFASLFVSFPLPELVCQLPTAHSPPRLDL
jgi:hypothetical protein